MYEQSIGHAGPLKACKISMSPTY